MAKMTLPKFPGFPSGLMKAVEAVNSRSHRERLMIFALAGAFLLVADYYLWMAPVLKVFKESVSKTSVLRARTQELQHHFENADFIVKKQRAKSDELARAEEAFIFREEVASLLEELSAQASASGLRIVFLQPVDLAPAALSKIYRAVPIEIRAESGTHELGKFLSRLETQQRFFRVRDLSISQNPQSPRRHNVGLTLECYRKELMA